ncbi:MAG: hypothetical protein U0990_09485 [Candidatus Nanopelagicales bacterium]|nr:hypothetical protein [Candidatus Nanopelagicales bacterium]
MAGVQFAIRVPLVDRLALRLMLRKVLPREANHAMRTAVNAAGTIILRKMRELCPVQKPRPHGIRTGVQSRLSTSTKGGYRGGNLKRSLGRKYSFYLADGNHVLLLGPRVTAPWKGRHGHLVEAGTKKREQKTTGQNTGIMPAFRFMERAMDATRFAALGQMQATFRDGLFRAIRKARRRRAA